MQWAKKHWLYLRVNVLTRVFLQQRKLWQFCQAAEKSGRNNKVTVQGCSLRNFLGALWASEIKS